MGTTNRDFTPSEFADAAGDGSGDSSNVLGGFAQASRLLEFDQVRQQLAAYTHTVLGRELAEALAPVPNLLDIATRQQETDEARRFLDGGGSLEFGPAVDLSGFPQRAILGGVLRGEELYAVQEMLAAARYDRSQLSRNEELPLLAGRAENIPNLEYVEQAIRSAISPAGEILDSASPALRQLRHDSRAAYNQLNEVMQRSLRRLQRNGVVQESIVTQRNGRLVLLIKAEMKNQAPGIVHDVSDSGATVFIEPMPAIDLGNRWRETRLAEEREEERVLRYLSSLIGDAGDDFQLTLDLIARLDLALSKGRYSIDRRATPPTVTAPPVSNASNALNSPDSPNSMESSPSVGAVSDRRLRLTGARHPLLSDRVVPISLELGEENGVMVITGPNAGGKTVALKTVGLLALMAHAGLHVPADDAQFPLLDGIYPDIGDQQSIEQSLSTFSSHIQNLRSILDRVTPRSLVLVDELGTSTDPEEGAALAEAILGQFHRLGALVVATTHHRGVARYVQEQEGMINASVDLDPQTLEPTYRVTLGLPGRSYALTIADRLGLASEIIEEARSFLSPTDREADELLHELQVERVVVERLRLEAEAAQALARTQQAEIEARLATVESERIDLVEESRQELQNRIGELVSQLQQAERSLRTAQEQAREQGREISPSTPRISPDELERQRRQLGDLRREVRSPQWQPIEVQRTRWQEELRSGDRVFIRGIPRPVEVITAPDNEQQVEVLLGTMRAKVPLYQLDRPADADPTAAQQGVYYRRPSPRQVESEIDLRGQRVDEALDRVEGLLNNASLASLEQVRIIHGRGTGVLRSAIREYLNRHPLVASAGSSGDGSGDGVTVVELK